jgi:cytochrome c-type biogenesis protein CcsB
VAAYGTLLAYLGLAFISASLVFRTIASGRGPFANMYEFSVAFAWGILVMYAYFERRYQQRALGLVALPIALALLRYAMTIPSAIDPLVPALQSSLLSVHVAVAIVAYGTFSISFAAAVLYLIQGENGRRGLPSHEILDEISYKAVVIGFPFLTLTIVLGAVWAEAAWGTYWSWDPKETASLVTWLIYGAYLHARAVRGWRGKRAAWLLLLGFGATLFTYFGNLFFGGLHSYSGLS